ncbi:MAG: CPBP family intramembrane metalloprotease [Clostridia bacterium]|nr:CPBP family intramembrane metalloprotease [Clostridia bacterium]
MTKKLESFLYVFLYIACYLVANVLAFCALPLFQTWRERGNADVFIYNLTRIQSSSIYALIISLVLSLLMFWGIFKIRKQPKSSYIKTGRLTVKSIAAAVFLTYGLNAVSELIASLKVLEPYTEYYNTTLESVLNGNIWVILFAVGFFAPVFEEVMYRGLILSEFNRAFPFLIANLFQALAFGIMHFNPIQSIYTFVVGFALGYVYKKSGTIYLTILIHIMFNVGNVIAGSVQMSYTVLAVSATASLFVGYRLLDSKIK